MHKRLFLICKLPKATYIQLTHTTQIQTTVLYCGLFCYLELILSFWIKGKFQALTAWPFIWQLTLVVTSSRDLLACRFYSCHLSSCDLLNLQVMILPEVNLIGIDPGAVSFIRSEFSAPYYDVSVTVWPNPWLWLCDLYPYSVLWSRDPVNADQTRPCQCCTVTLLHSALQ